MKALRLEFARSPAAPRWAAWTLLAVAAAFAAEVGRSYVAVRSEIEYKELRLAKTVREHGDPNVIRVSLRPASPEEMRFARDTIRRLATPWDRLFDALEGAKTKGVSLLSVEPDPVSGKVTVSGEARDYLAVLNYVAALAADKRLRQVYLVKHETKTGDPKRTLLFTVSALWSDKR